MNAMDYAKEGTVEEFLSVCTGGMDKATAQAIFPERLSLAAAWGTQESASARCLILQNRRDHHHLEYHLRPFAAELGLDIPGTSTDGRMRIMLYDFPNGHGAEPRSMLPGILRHMRKLRIPV